ncbi:site-specific integrase [Geomonas subterranea]|uniref:Site-specific integrase n=1 Tax=Geomonas subterranea TaxID=2847989 RepID=A0ABX8LLQ1_9BACT|nr:site-specific integrase [Geomonas subterranea]QXE92434.1 site-specific integrase [Geomonas subterranea]QXM09467.1 site-specific integrase [Geomonas subterranea]
MRPFVQGLSVFREHVYLRNGIYYFRLDVPQDLTHYFPAKEIKRSLRTSDPSIAKIAANKLEMQTLRAYALLRLGMLTDDMVKLIVQELVPLVRKAEPQSKNKLLINVIQTYTAEKQAGWTEKTKLEVEGVFKLLVDIMGNVDVSTITRPMLIDLRSSLLKVPPYFYHKYRGQSVKDVIASNTGEGMSPKTVNKHVARIGSLLKYCHEQEMIPRNPATGLQLSLKQRADEERSTYTLTDIKNLVAHLPMDPGTPERYWIPLIGLYSGLRLNEICQLHIEDFVKLDDYWCFDINDTGDKRLKNAASARMIPVHPKLIELGMIRYYEKCKDEKQPRLWMNLGLIRLHGYTNGIGKWYARYNRDYVTEDPKKVFHSMRHTVADVLKQKGISEAAIAEILGHAHATITSGRYGKRYQPKVLLEALKHLNYGVDIPVWKA